MAGLARNDFFGPIIDGLLPGTLQTLAGNGSAVATDVYIEVTAAGTLTLEAAPSTNRFLIVKRNYLGAAYTISGNGNNIDGLASIALAPDGASVSLFFNGTEWSLI